MACIFCIAVLAIVGGATAASTVEGLKERLAKLAVGSVRLVAETDSVAKLEADVTVLGRAVPVAVTLYKEFGRLRIQLLSHDLDRSAIEQVEDELARVLTARIVSRSDEDGEAKVRQARVEQTEEEKRERRRERPTARRP